MSAMGRKLPVPLVAGLGGKQTFLTTDHEIAKLAPDFHRLAIGNLSKFHALLGGSDHLRKPRLVSQAVDVRVMDCQADDVCASARHNRLDHRDGPVGVLEYLVQTPGKIVSHHQIARIDEEASLDPLLSALQLAETGQARSTERKRCSIVRIRRENLLDLPNHSSGGTLLAVDVALSMIVGKQHAQAVKIGFHDLRCFFEMKGGVL